jgi:tetratricopeptide (TPR) repeat protein
VVLGRAVLEHVLGRGDVLLVLEEERPVGVGFVVVVGWEPSADLLLLAEPGRAGAAVRAMATQRRRSALGGQGALIVAAAGPTGEAALEVLRAAGIVDDDRLALVDRAHFDPADPDAPHAHVAQLARAAIAVAPEHPDRPPPPGRGPASRSVGSAGLDDDELPLERWVAETRERFPDAEWPRQLYAEALELWRRWPEALVAWADASRIDGDDPRNHLGQVRGAREVGGLRGARHGLRRALRLDPGQGEAWAWLADEELASGDLDAAQAALDLAAARRPDAIDVLTRQATLAERRGEQAAAAALLERACLGDVLERGQTMRRWRHHLWAGEFAALQALAERRLVDRYPSAPSAWSVMIDGALMVGDRDLALAAIDGALQRCVPSGELLDNMVEVLATVLSADELDPALRSLEHRLAGQSDPLIRIARGLGFAGHRAASVAALTRLCERYPHDANAPYSLAQILAGSPDAAAVAAPLGQALGAALALAEHFPWVRILLGWHQLATAPDEALRTVAPVADAVPALGWDLMARALAATGRADGAAELRARLPEVASAIPDQLGFLRRAGLMTAARELGAVALAAGELSVRLEHARTLAAIGATDEALTLVEAAYGADVSDPFVGVWLLKLAAQAGADFRVEDEYPSVVACCQADSQRFADPWIPIALAAGVGVDAARTTLAARAPHHLGALRQRARAARAVGAATAADDLAALATLAPGSASTIDHPEL